MKKEIVELTAENFDKLIAKGNWIVDFWAEWCNPCKIMEPEFESAAKKLDGKVNLGKINVEEQYDLASRFQVMSIPTTIFFKNKEQVNRTVGAIDEREILKVSEESF